MRSSIHIFASLFLLLTCSPWLLATDYSLSVAMIFRDEAPYLKEWIEFHRLMGVQHFYLCSHNSTDHYRVVLRPYIAQKIVELKEIKDADHETQVSFNELQLNFYNECLTKAKISSDWIAFIDSDEFLFPAVSSNLLDVLDHYRDCAGVAVNWRLFGTSSIPELATNKLLIEQLIWAAPLDCQGALTVKCIVQPKKVHRFGTTPHSPDFKPGCYQVNSDYLPFHGPFSPYLQLNTLRINHYWTRDEYYFYHHKVPRQTQWLGFTKTDIEHIPELYNQELDESILRFAPQLRKKMKRE